jgi:hypothetical protein
MLLSIDRYPHPRSAPIVERSLNCRDCSLEVGCRRGLAGPFSRRVPQLELGSRYNHDLDGGKQDEQQERQYERKLDRCAPRLTHPPSL